MKGVQHIPKGPKGERLGVDQERARVAAENGPLADTREASHERHHFALRFVTTSVPSQGCARGNISLDRGPESRNKLRTTETSLVRLG